jgi:predicted nucleic-acid-binding Zn-ribbon protein
MNKHIQNPTCPHCGCTEVVKQEVETETGGSKIRVHSNGQRWERVTLTCGLGFSWLPNYQRATRIGCCRRDPRRVVGEAQRAKFLARMVKETEKWAKKGDLDPHFATFAKNQIQGWLWAIKGLGYDDEERV